jgi:hypothetical protein
MRITRQGIGRRTIIEAYAEYDCSKKRCSLPAFAAWDWSQADAIDREMKREHLKIGIPAGFLLWDEVELTMPDLHECAVEGSIFPGQSRKLGLVGAGEIHRWCPDRDTAWYEHIVGGRALDGASPMLLRPTVSKESPASSYIEDGSGRAIAFVANQHLFDLSQTLAVGYLGRKPDPHSSFMQKEFPELLRR